MKRYLGFIIVFPFILFACHNNTKKDFYDFKNNPKISDKNGTPISYYSSFFPYDSLSLIDLYAEIDKVHNRLLTKFPKSDTSEFNKYCKQKNPNNLIDTIVPNYFGQIGNADEFLKAMKEKILYNFYLDKTVYRLTVLRTFHNPFSIILETSKNSESTICLKITNGHGGYYAGNLIRFDKHKVDNSMVDSLNSILNKFKFDTLSRDLNSKDLTLDGSVWFFEIHNKSGYKLIETSNPINKSIFMDIFSLMSKECRYEFKDIY